MVHNDFISTWDDGVYVVQNQLLHDLSWQGIINIFTYGDEFQKIINNYHPLTTLSLALNYQLSGLSPAAYQTTNMVLHGLNAVLAFLFIYLLSRRKLWPAIISGLLFAIHPMHVESVAWISERKDVLYTFFFLAGLISYLKYLEDEKVWKLGIAALLFLFSCLSKAMAVPFPLILLLVDYFQRRKFSWRLLIEKIPFFVIALIIGLLSVHLQSLSAINKFETFTLYQRIMHASYGFISYIFKFFAPADLSAFYPYPAITQTGLLPFSFRIAPYVCLVIAGILVWFSTRKSEIARVIVFGILFYFFTIALVLQFLSVGKAIIAERYSYIPYLGLSFIPGMLADYFIRRKSPQKYIGYGIAAGTLVMCFIFSFITHERTKMWKDDITLWSDVLRQYPDGRLNFIYEKRARQYLATNQYEAALTDFQRMSANDPRDDNALESIGKIYGRYFKDIGKATEYLQKAYAINPKNPAVLKSLGVVTGMKGDFTRSLGYLLQAYEIDRTDTALLQNITASYSLLGMPAKAKEFDQLLRAAKSK
jgi:protein O-mannosyl-transferase